MRYLVALLVCIILCNQSYASSTTSAVTLVGGIIKSTHADKPEQKYKRKNCPVCKGTGKYLSGDSIKMVDCGYCEPENTQQEKIVTHPPVIIHDNKPKCTGPNCRIR